MASEPNISFSTHQMVTYGTHTITIFGADRTKRSETFIATRSVMTIQVKLRSTETEIIVYAGERLYI